MRLLSKIAVVVPVLVLAAVPGAAMGASKIGSASASGDYAIALASGTAENPGTINVRVTASPRQRVSVSWTMVCSKGLGAGSKSGQFSARTTVTRALRKPQSNPDSCTVSASAQLDNGGRVRVTLYG